MSYPKHCEMCKTSIGKHDDHYNDIPGVGNLCNPCHVGWAEEGENIMTEKKEAFIKKLCIDFDGVLHSYTSGWQGNSTVADEPVPGAIEWLRELIEDPTMEPMIYSSRSKSTDGVQAMQLWLKKNGLTEEELNRLSFPVQKPSAWITIDDRCFLFTGEFPSKRVINEFTPWNK